MNRSNGPRASSRLICIASGASRVAWSGRELHILICDKLGFGSTPSKDVCVVCKICSTAYRCNDAETALHVEFAHNAMNAPLGCGQFGNLEPFSALFDANTNRLVRK